MSGVTEQRRALAAQLDDLSAVELVSLPSALSPRLLNFFQTRSRRSRRVENIRKGSTLERVLTMTHFPEDAPLVGRRTCDGDQ